MTSSGAKIVDTEPVLNLLGGKKRYEKFLLEGIGESHNNECYAVEDQQFLGKEGFGEEVSRQAGTKVKWKNQRPIDATFKEIARRLEVAPELLRGKDRRWKVSAQRAKAVANLVRDDAYTVSEVASYLQRDQANISTMLSSLHSIQTKLLTRNGLQFFAVTALALLSSCTLPYSPPSVLDESISAVGVANVLSLGTDVDVLLVHGMCTHGEQWVIDANNSLRKALGISEEFTKADLPTPQKITDGTASYMEVYTIQPPPSSKHLRTHAIVWSPAVAPWKRRLCYDGQDNTDGDKLCAEKPDFQPVRAAINSSVKETLLNDCLSDAMIYVGEARALIQHEMWNSVLTALGHRSQDKSTSALKTALIADNTSLFIITASLGSKILYDILWKMSQEPDNEATIKAIFGAVFNYSWKRIRFRSCHWLHRLTRPEL